MSTYIIRRVMITIIILFIVTFITFSLLHITPGDPVIIMLGLNSEPQLIESLRKELRLDQPFISQYLYWLGDIFQGNLGRSIRYKMPVTELMVKRLPISMYFGLLGLIFSTTLGIIGGIISAVNRGKAIDMIISVLANTGVAIPVFWLGILLIYIFGFKLGWLPIAGYTSPFDDFLLHSRQAVLPIICMSVIPLSVYTRQTRSSILEIIAQDYIRTARAKGLRDRVVLMKHALRNALITIVTLMGLQARWIVAGSVVTETIFNIPGIGRLLVSSVLSLDFPVVQASVLVIAITVSLVNLIVDISYAWLDPRILYE